MLQEVPSSHRTAMNWVRQSSKVNHSLSLSGTVYSSVTTPHQRWWLLLQQLSGIVKLSHTGTSKFASINISVWPTTADHLINCAVPTCHRLLVSCFPLTSSLVLCSSLRERPNQSSSPNFRNLCPEIVSVTASLGQRNLIAIERSLQRSVM